IKKICTTKGQVYPKVQSNSELVEKILLVRTDKHHISTKDKNIPVSFRKNTKTDGLLMNYE
ncbi:hypothetical protein QUF07_04680, partial [Lentilactobacillus sp. TOM.63]|uniref:hypothetical protein n=1 Tax=Lentilactobacillus sp. TOM.63 TaxID=3055077 RepID=UPI00259FE575